MDNKTKKLMEFITDRTFFPNCIECDPDTYLEPKLKSYFHTPTCQRGHGLSPEELTRRINERIRVFIERHGEDGCGVKCKLCSNAATGVMRVLFHNTNTVAEHWHVCMDHAFHEDTNGRECRYGGF